MFTSLFSICRVVQQNAALMVSVHRLATREIPPDDAGNQDSRGASALSKQGLPEYKIPDRTVSVRDGILLILKYYFKSCLAITSFCTSEVPSPIVHNLESL